MIDNLFAGARKNPAVKAHLLQDAAAYARRLDSPNANLRHGEVPRAVKRIILQQKRPVELPGVFAA